MPFASNRVFYFIFLITLSSVCGSSVIPVEAWFDEKDVELGTSESMIAKTISVRHCAIRCLFDVEYRVYQYNIQAQQNCVLHENTTQDGSPLTSNQQSRLYEKVVHEENEVDDSHNWTRPPEWNSGDSPIVYHSFDNNITSDFQLKNGAQLVAGKVNNAIKTDLDKQQWVSLGNLSGVVCLAIPDSCGLEGGAFSAWIMIENCGGDGGIISSSYAGSLISEGFLLYCQGNGIGYVLMLQRNLVVASTSRPTQWFHLVLNYLGPDQGATIYQDGEEHLHQGLQDVTQTAGTGIVVIGRHSPVSDDRYTSVMMDELMFFNRKLTSNEAQILYNQYK